MNKLRLILNKAAKTAEILIYGPIGGSFWDDDGITARQFNEKLDEIPSDYEITVAVNSQGGSVGEGLAIYNAIKRRSEKITARVDGYALSAGSFIPLAASKVVSPKSALWMIHKGWLYAAGNADEMRKAAELLDKHDETIIQIYEERTGKAHDEIEVALAEETWFTGEEAIAWGLADEEGGNESEDVAEAMAGVNIAQHPKAFANPTQFLDKLAACARSTMRSIKSAFTEGTANRNQQRPEPSGRAETGTAMKREQVIALLKKHGQTVDDSATDEQLVQQLEQLLEAQQGAAVVADGNSDTKEITDLLKSIENRLANPPAAASAPLGGVAAGRAQDMGNPLIERFNAFERNDHNARAQFVRCNHRELRRNMITARQGDLTLPVAANTVDANLVNSVIAGDFLTTMRTALAPLAAFSHRVTNNAQSARAVLNVNLVSSVGAVQSNPTNFETGDSVSTAKQVTINHISKSFYAANSESDLGLDLMQKAPTNARVMAEGIFAVVSALMTTGNYGAAAATDAAADFDTDTLAAILAAAKNYPRTTLLMDGGHLAYLLPLTKDYFRYGEPGAYGFDGGIYKNNLWTGATANTVGFVTGPDAIVWAAGPPAQTPQGNYMTTQEIMLPDIDLTVSSYVWFSLASRSIWASYDVCFGAAVGDATQAELIASA